MVAEMCEAWASVLSGVWLSALAWWQADENVLERVWRWTGPVRYYVNFRWQLGNFVFSAATLALGLLVLLVAVVVSRYARAFLERRMTARRLHHARTMAQRPPQIVAFGGGGFSMEAGNPLLDDYVLELTGAERPRVPDSGSGAGPRPPRPCGRHTAPTS